MRREKNGDEKPKASEAARFSRANWFLLGSGLVMLILGFVVLAVSDERAANLAGRLSPFLVLGGYIALFVGLVYRPAK